MMGSPERKRLQDLRLLLEEHASKMLGYPSAMDIDYSELKDFMDFPINNIGDPFIASTYKLETREFEREVMQFWAKQTCAPDDNWWGYVTNGGTEGNLYGLYLARERYPEGVVYFSKDTHYSVPKNLHFLNMRNIMIRSQDNGEIDYDDLYETIKIRQDVPPIIFANIGTTMTEAKDDICKIKAMLEDLAIPQYYIHSDAAMSGGMAPFLEPKPAWDFADGADSIAISGHKFIGSPIPCGLVLAKKTLVNRIARSVAYIGTMDTTITGSRSGLSPLILWYAIKYLGEQGLRMRANQSLEYARYAEKKLNEIGVLAWRNSNALTVVMPRVSDWVQDKWQLASARNISHIMLMPSRYINRQMIDRFVADVALSRSSSG